MPPQPLSATGHKLLASYIRRAAFVDAIARGATIAFAGDAILSVKPGRAHEIHRETPDHVALCDWLRQRAGDAIRRGLIGPGRATAKSPEADLLFGATMPFNLAAVLAGREVVALESLVRGIPEIDAESIDYHVYNGRHTKVN